LDKQTAKIVQKCYDVAKKGLTHYSEALTFRGQPHIAYYDARKENSNPVLINMNENEINAMRLKFKKKKKLWDFLGCL
jgi:hypothetical protein